MLFESPIEEFVAKVALRRESAEATIAALAVATESCDPKVAQKIRRLIVRQENCLNSFYLRVTQPDGGASVISISNKRPCRSRHCSPCSPWLAKLKYEKIVGLYDEVLVEHPTAVPLLLTLTLPTQPIDSATLVPLQTALKRYEPPRVRRRLFGLSHAASLAGSSRAL